MKEIIRRAFEYRFVKTTQYGLALFLISIDDSGKYWWISHHPKLFSFSSLDEVDSICELMLEAKNKGVLKETEIND